MSANATAIGIGTADANGLGGGVNLPFHRKADEALREHVHDQRQGEE